MLMPLDGLLPTKADCVCVSETEKVRRNIVNSFSGFTCVVLFQVSRYVVKSYMILLLLFFWYEMYSAGKNVYFEVEGMGLVVHII